MRCFLKRIGRRAGKVASVVASEIGPTLPPAISTMSWVARSMALVCKVASTPRSKRCDESVCKPKLRAFPAIASGAKNAHSRKTD